MSVFAIPGILALLVFIYLRPQEVFEAARALPFLHLFLLLTLAGFVIDLAIRKIQAKATPQLRWAVVFLIWAIITMAIGVRSMAHVSTRAEPLNGGAAQRRRRLL